MELSGHFTEPKYNGLPDQIRYNRLTVHDIDIFSSVTFPGFENPVEQYAVVVTVLSSCGRLFKFYYTSRSWLNKKQVFRFIERVMERGSIDPQYWGVL